MKVRIACVQGPLLWVAVSMQLMVVQVVAVPV